MKIHLTIILMLFSSLLIFAQEKREVERKIKEAEVPEKAVTWLHNTYYTISRINWYEEISSEKRSYEAKFKWKGKWHSVEFDQVGMLEDIEIAIRKKELPQKVQDVLWKYFEATYTKFKIKKIQQQWTGKSEILSRAIMHDDLTDVIIRYEIEFYGKNDHEDDLWEGLFSSEGQLIQRKKVILRPTDNLIY